MTSDRFHAGTLLLALLAAFAVSDAPSARASSELAETLARSTYFEGVPYAEASALSDEGVARLVEMLDDPDESTHRAQIIELLGMSGGPGAYEAISAVAAETPTGEIDGDSYRTRVAILAGLGHLARDDDRALADLARTASSSAEAPRWSHRHLRGTRLAGLLQRSAVTSLAMSGRPEAEAILRELRASAGSGSPELRRHLDSALDLAARVRRDGPAASFERQLPGDAQ